MNEAPVNLISVVAPCYNEEENVEPLYHRVKAQFEGRVGFDFELIYIDNASTDTTRERIKALASKDSRVKLIANVRNFGHIRSPIHALYQASGQAVVGIASDLEDPPELIDAFIKLWMQGHLMVIAVKESSEESRWMTAVRASYYRALGSIAEAPLINDFTGFGLYDRSVIELMSRIDDSYPYFRGLIAELGIPYKTVPFKKLVRQFGITKNGFLSLFDLAVTGLTNHSRLPLRLATLCGSVLGVLSFALAMAYLTLKLIYWDSFSMGTAPVLIGVFFFAAVQLFFIGMVGEYVGAIHRQVYKRPLVIERERINLPPSPSLPQHSYKPPVESSVETQ